MTTEITLDKQPLTLSQRSQEKLNSSDQVAQQIIDAGLPASTQRACESDYRYFFNWMKASYPEITGLPIPVKIVQAFITDHLGAMDKSVEQALSQNGKSRKGTKSKKGKHKLSTIKRRISMLKMAHEIGGYSDHVIYTKDIKLLLKSAGNNPLEARKQQDAITKDVFDALIAACDPETFRGLRDRALLSVGVYSGGRRRSELTALKMDDLKKVSNDDDSFYYLWSIRQSKTHQYTELPAVVPIIGKAATWLNDWLEATEITEGSIFKQIDRYGNVRDSALKPAAVRDIVLRLQEKAELQHLKLSAHSIRSGFVTQALSQDISIQETMALSLHKDVATFMSYNRDGLAISNKAKSVFE